MKILFDFRSYQYAQRGGIGRFVLSLVSEMIKINDLEMFVLVSNQYEKAKIPEDILDKITVLSLENFENYDFKENFDFFFKGCFFNPINGLCPDFVFKRCNDVVAIVHDFIPLIFENEYLISDESKINYLNQLETAKYASHFFANSKQTAQDAKFYLNKSDDEVSVIYGGVNRNLFIGRNSDKEYKFSDRKNIIVYVSRDDFRKNYNGLAKAFAQAYSKKKIPEDSKLYLIGLSGSSFVKEIKFTVEKFGLHIGKQIIIPGYLKDEEMIEIISTSKASFFPSFYEGLGLPILESYSLGTPCFGSWNSAVKEFVPKDCTFNPYDTIDIEHSIIKAFNNEKFCQKNLAFGRDILKDINWKNAAEIVLKKLNDLKKKREEKSEVNDKVKVALFGMLSYMPSGSTFLNQKTALVGDSRFDIFSNMESSVVYNRHLLFSQNIFPLGFYEFAQRKEKYKAKIFVIDNTRVHCIPILKEAIKTKGEENRSLYLNKSFLLDLLLSVPEISSNSLDIFLERWYPCVDKPKKDENVYDWSDRVGLLGIKPLIYLTGIRKIFVNSEKEKKLIFSELSNYERKNLDIKVVFKPVSDIDNDLKFMISSQNRTGEMCLDESKTEGFTDKFNRIRDGYDYVVGSFGIPGSHRFTEKIIEAVKKINKEKRLKIKLIIAGFYAEQYKNENKLSSYNFITVFDSLPYDDWFELMNSVDLAVQLKHNHKEQVSESVAELIGLGKNILSTEEVLNDDMKSCCRTVKDSVSTDELSESILISLKNIKSYDKRRIIEKYSYSKFVDYLYENA